MDEPVSTLSHIRTLTKYNFLLYFRARRFYIILAIALIISGPVAFAAAYYKSPGNTTALGFYSSGWGAFSFFIVIFSVALFGGDAISGEFQNRTGYFILPLPITRSSIYIGKWLAALVASTIIISIFASLMLANGIYFFGMSGLSELFQSILFAWVYIVAALSLVFVFSSLFKNGSFSILMSIILLLFVFTVIDGVLSAVSGIEPWFSINYAAGIIPNILIVPYPPHSFSGIFNATVPEGLIIFAAYFLAGGVLGLWLFKLKEFT